MLCVFWAPHCSQDTGWSPRQAQRPTGVNFQTARLQLAKDQHCSGPTLTLHPLNTGVEEDSHTEAGDVRGPICSSHPIRAGICHPPPGTHPSQSISRRSRRVEAHSTDYFLQELQSGAETDLTLSSLKKDKASDHTGAGQPHMQLHLCLEPPKCHVLPSIPARCCVCARQKAPASPQGTWEQAQPKTPYSTNLPDILMKTQHGG